jgi:hypothetical protein
MRIMHQNTQAMLFGSLVLVALMLPAAACSHAAGAPSLSKLLELSYGGEAGYRACVIYQSGGSGVYRFWEYDKDFWGDPDPDTAVKKTCYESEGWDTLH